MTDFNFNNNVANPSLDEVLVGATVQGTPDGGNFTLLNAANGYSISFLGNDFSYNGITPTGGTITGISVRNAGGTEIFNVTDFSGSLAAFWGTFAASGYQWSGSAAAFTSLFALTDNDNLVAGESSDRIGLYGAAGSAIGKGGNDTFIVNEGVLGTNIYGVLLPVDDVADAAQTDVVEIHGSAMLGSFQAIDLVRFADTPTAKTLTFNASAAFGAKAVQGSAAGIDTIKFTSTTEQVNLNLSTVQFTNWGRANQSILVDLNTDVTQSRDDRFVGSAVSERVTANGGRDLLYGNAGDDYLDGGEGIDVLDGGDGNDTLIGGSDRGRDGPNILKGGNGNDVYKFNEKVDIVIDSGGLDSRMVSKNSTLSANDKFEGLAADDTLTKAISLTGNAKVNILIGHSGKNSLKGMNGNDILEGHMGSDQLDGGAGNDKLYGGLGNDKLTGGAGRDTFYFDTALGGNVDKIVSFSTRDDKIALAKEVFTLLSGSKLSSSAFYIGSRAKDAADLIVYNKSTGALSYDVDGSGAAAAVKFATLDKNLKLTASDFILI